MTDASESHERRARQIQRERLNACRYAPEGDLRALLDRLLDYRSRADPEDEYRALMAARDLYEGLVWWALVPLRRL